MLKWLDGYYIGDGIQGNVRIQSKINAGKAVPGIWLITLSDNPDNLMEIIPADMLLVRSVYDTCPMIIGMAKGKKGAIKQVKKIIETMYKKTGSLAIRDYLKNR